MKSVQGDDMLQVRKADVTARVPPHVFFFVSAIFHYLGPAFAVLLFSSVPVLGVAWFRMASAACTRSGARSDECVLLPCDLAYPIGNRGSYRVPWSHYTCCTRDADSPEHLRIASGCRGWVAPDGCALRRAAAGVCLCVRQLCLLHAIRGARPPYLPGAGSSRD